MLKVFFIGLGMLYLMLAIPSAVLACKHNLYRIAYFRCLPYFIFGLLLIFVIDSFITAVIFWSVLHIFEAIMDHVLGMYDHEQIVLTNAMKEWFESNK